MKTSTEFKSLVSSFLTKYLAGQRQLSENTILAYRDSLKLLIKFIVYEKKIKLSRFPMKKLTKSLVLEFLGWLEKNGSSLSTRNNRLSAIKTFAQYAAEESLENMDELLRIVNIQSSTSVSREIQFLRVEQTRKFVNRPDVNNKTGLRHRVILSLLYDGALRVSELCNLRLEDLDTTAETLHVFGKGKKNRTITISANTVKLVKLYLNKYRSKALSTDYLVVNKQNQKLTRGGVTYIVQKYIDEISAEDPNFPKKLHPHCLRHSKAMHMLEAGLPLIYIRDFLGHNEISSTEIYAKTDRRLREQAVNKVAPKLIDDIDDVPDVSKDSEFLDFLSNFD